MSPSRTDILPSPTHDKTRRESSAAADAPDPATTDPSSWNAQDDKRPKQKAKGKGKGKEKVKDTDEDADEVPGQRRHRIRSSGGFLLHNVFRDRGGTSGGGASRAQHRDQPGDAQKFQKSNLTPRTSTSERSGLSPGTDDGSSFGASASLDSHLGSPSTTDKSPRTRSGGPSTSLANDTKHVAGSQVEMPNGAPVDQGYHGSSSRRQTGQPPDIDPALIVNMALNLSESRRAASRRSASAASAAAIPPGLAPLPNAATATGASLQHHLQQQRRSSRNISPRPDRALSARLAAPSAR